MLIKIKEKPSKDITDIYKTLFDKKTKIIVVIIGNSEPAKIKKEKILERFKKDYHG